MGKKHKYLDDESFGVITPEEAEHAATAIEKYVNEYMTFLILRNISDKKLEKYKKKLRNMVKLIRDPKTIMDVFNLKFIRIIKEEYSSDEDSGLFG